MPFLKLIPGTLGRFVMDFCWRDPSYETWKNVLFLTIGPPMPPPNVLRRKGGMVAGSKKLRASIALFRSDSNASPLKVFVPDLLTELKTPPMVRPYWALRLLVCT